MMLIGGVSREEFEGRVPVLWGSRIATRLRRLFEDSASSRAMGTVAVAGDTDDTSPPWRMLAHEELRPFCLRCIPSVTFVEYVGRMLLYLPVTVALLCTAVALIIRIERRLAPLPTAAMHKTVFASLWCAHLLLDEPCLENSFGAAVAGVSVAEITELTISFMNAAGWKYPSDEEMGGAVQRLSDILHLGPSPRERERDTVSVSPPPGVVTYPDPDPLPLLCTWDWPPSPPVDSKKTPLPSPHPVGRSRRCRFWSQ